MPSRPQNAVWAIQNDLGHKQCCRGHTLGHTECWQATQATQATQQATQQDAHALEEETQAGDGRQRDQEREVGQADAAGHQHVAEVAREDVGAREGERERVEGGGKLEARADAAAVLSIT